jgi:hypothetical protein
VQFEPLHDRHQRWAIVVAHRRAGKTVACINDLIRAAVTDTKQDPRYAYVAPTYGQAKDVAWNYLRHYTAPIPMAAPHETELRVDLPNKSRVRLYGADNYDRMRGIYLDGVVLDEFGDMEPRAWEEVIRPALSDRKGWAVFIGTPRGRNHFADLWGRALADPDWFTLQLPASKTRILPNSELEDARKSMTPEQYSAEYECSFAAPVVGSYYGADVELAEKDRRITRVPYDKSALVHTAWDLGIGDSTAIWFAQTVGREIHIIDFIENKSVGLDWYIAQVRNRPYMYGEHIWPHDGGAMELGIGRTREETARKLGLNPRVLPRDDIADGINAARMMFNRCWFDADKCSQGIDALRNYRRDYDTKRKVFKDHPLHDWSSDAADAFRYLAVGLKPDQKTQKLKYENRGIV